MILDSARVLFVRSGVPFYLWSYSGHLFLATPATATALSFYAYVRFFTYFSQSTALVNNMQGLLDCHFFVFQNAASAALRRCCQARQ